MKNRNPDGRSLWMSKCCCCCRRRVVRCRLASSSSAGDWTEVGRRASSLAEAAAAALLLLPLSGVVGVDPTPSRIAPPVASPSTAMRSGVATVVEPPRTPRQCPFPAAGPPP
ncbi:unnamed protein product [Ectocarpus sp. 8 AP-2014]